MEFDKGNYAQYLITRFRQLGSKTSNWAIVFLAALIYTWFASIYPRAEFIRSYITVLDKKTYFDTLSRQFTNEKRAYIKINRDSFLRLSALIDTGKRLNKFETVLQKSARLTKKPDSLVALVRKAASLKGQEKKDLMRAIRKNYLAVDIFVAMTKIGSADAEKQRDSLLKTSVTFEIPGLKSFSVGFKEGLIVWMILALILFAYLFSVRLKMIEYLKAIYANQRLISRSNTSEWKKLDLQIPIWLTPVRFSQEKDQAIFRAMIGWKFTALTNAVGIAMLVIVFMLQLFVAWMLWHVSILSFFESTWSKFIALFVIAINLLILVFWLQPIEFNNSFSQQNHFHFGRREFIKMVSTSMVLLFAIPAIGRTLPLMDGNPLNYRRKRHTKPENSLLLDDGFYYRLDKKKIVVHYFKQGKSSSLSHLPNSKLAALKPKLKPIALNDLITNEKCLNYHIPGWYHAFEIEAYKYAIKKEYATSISILLFTLHYALVRGIVLTYSLRSYDKVQQKVSIFGTKISAGNTLARIKHFIVGLMLKAETEQPGNYFAKIRPMINEKIIAINNTTFDNMYITNLSKGKKFVRKWTKSTSLPWKLPNDKHK